MSIIGISGYATSGKDTVGKIIQILTNSPHFTNEAVVDFLNKPVLQSKWTVRKFADKLKDIVCLLIDCTREQLEDAYFKEKELGEEWWYWVIINFYNNKIISPLFITQEEAKQWEQAQQWYEDTGGYDTCSKLIKLTPRLLLQLLGTECGRQIIHPNIWVNALMSEYKPSQLLVSKIRRVGLRISPQKLEESLPNWIITDTRFPNEAKAIKYRKGILIRINRIQNNNIPPHESETAMDDYNHFDYTIHNHGSLENLVYQVRHILSKENFI